MEEAITKESKEVLERKAHPWRRCPIGKHFVKEHLEHIAPSKLNPHGTIITRHEHCASNPSDKDELSFDEIQYITETYFSTLPAGPPASGKSLKFPNVDKYDDKIRGWTRYWNEVFKPNVPLNPNLIKALIATESSFDENPKTKTKIKTAYGLMQIKSDTLRYLGDTKGELTNYLICLSKTQLLNPSANICAGIRWLFQKKKLAKLRLGREPTWIEAIIEYKSYWDEINAKEPVEAMNKLQKYYETLQRQ